MERRVYSTKLKAEWRAAYIEAHKRVPPVVLDVYKNAGMAHCSVFLLDETLVLLIEAEDVDATFRKLENDPDDAAWQAQVRPMKGDGDWQPMTPIFYKDFV